MHPVPELEALVRKAVAEAFGAELAGTDPAVHRSSFADFQADVALRLARSVKRPPLEVAQRIAERIDASELCAAVRVSPPGFVNFVLREEYLEQVVSRLAHDPRVGVTAPENPETVVVDYSAPNVAKEMHVGHLRPTAIGDAIVRMLDLLGQRVIRQNHVGDWGTPFGMLIEHLLDTHPSSDGSGLELGTLNEFYKAARQKFDSQPEFAERSRQRVVLLQGGDEQTLRLWKTLVDASRRYFETVYQKFGALLVDEDVRGESFYNSMLANVAEELEAKGIARVDQEALCVFLPEFKGREGDPLPLIVRKKDGGYGYATTDLAALRFRAQQLGAARVLYVVGATQQQHFAMVFGTARAAGWLSNTRVEHVAFGSILGTDRKMFRTRSGDTPRLVDLLDEAIERADAAIREKNPDLPEDVRRQVAHSVGVGAIKYADLSTERMKDYVFDWARMLSFEGNTGPYLQYAHARIASILRRAEEQGVAGPSEDAEGAARVRLEQPQERALALELLEFSSSLRSAADVLQPQRVCTYLYGLATRFTAFYEACPVLKAETPEIRASRLLLCEATRRTLAVGLSVLGMDAPDRM